MTPPNDPSADEDDDLTFFRQALVTVKPLPPNKKCLRHPQIQYPKVQHTAMAVPTPTLTPPSFTLKKKHSLFVPDPPPEDVAAETTLVYAQHALPPKRMRQLQQGRIPYEARLDLHGLRSEAAEQALHGFIEHQHRLHHRCVLIIHGKGGLHGEAPILKNNVNQWLRCNPHILAFHSAPPQYGGTGALFVLLKRHHHDTF